MKVRILVLDSNGVEHKGQAAEMTDEELTLVHNALEHMSTARHIYITTDVGRMYFNPAQVIAVTVRKLR